MGSDSRLVITGIISIGRSHKIRSTFMSKLASLLALTLLLSSPLSLAEADRSSSDIRYCLGMKSNHEIAKCAGEISPGNKGKPLSRKEAERILSRENASAPASTNESSGTPATAGDKPGKGLSGQTENTGN